MSSYRLVGVTRPADAKRLLNASSASRFAELTVVEAHGLAAVLTPARKPLAAWLQTRKAEMNGLLAFQKLLEAISADAPILPAAYGSALIETDQALALLTAHVGPLKDELEAYGSLVQFQIEVRWDPIKAMAVLKSDGRLAGLDFALANRDRAVFGSALQALMEAERHRLGSGFQAQLAAVARDTVRLPHADEAMLLNVAALIARIDEPALDKAVEAIDASMPDVLSIRYVGPLPAVSFANITIIEPEQGQLRKAHAILGTSGDASIDAVKQAFRLAMRQAHPDADGAQASSDAAANLAKAHALAIKAALAPRTAKGSPLLLDIRREGDATARNAASNTDWSDAA
jgi:DnaJ-domain-containing protein 1